MARYLLDFSESTVCRTESYCPNGVSDYQVMKELVTPDGVRFLDRKGWCPYCQTDAAIVFDKWEHYTAGPCARTNAWDDLSARAWSCEKCGWWDMVSKHVLTYPLVGYPEAWWDVRAYGVLRRYDVSSLNIPISSVRSVLRAKGEYINHLHPHTLEKLVASVLADYFPNCEVRLCGRTKDGGIDLLVVMTDKTFAIQVKRRARADSVERVMPVREFLGASVAEGYNHLIYISTAGRFTSRGSGAQEFAQKVVERGVVRSFELVNRDEFLGLLDLVPSQFEEYWHLHMPPLLTPKGYEDAVVEGYILPTRGFN